MMVYFGLSIFCPWHCYSASYKQETPSGYLRRR
ncbi:hypothetical protein AHF37_12347 [Paragonimus kellicotti]|nr:hypothetical protein AHF37_12347 [Paragonimus kellicotti]